jgi:hypothetical protein
MFQIFAGYAVGTAIVAAVTLAFVSPGSAASRRLITEERTAESASHSPRYYDYAPGESGQRTNPALPGESQFGPPDPASCEGFHC